MQKKVAANDMPSAATWEVLTRKIPTINASGKVKEKAEPRTRTRVRAQPGGADVFIDEHSSE